MRPSLFVPVILASFAAAIMVMLAAPAGVQADTVSAAASRPAFGAATVPPPGGLSMTVAASDDLEALTAAIPFEVASLALFDIGRQRWITYTPGAPGFVNQPFVDSLRHGAIVWATRSAHDRRGDLVWSRPALLNAVEEPGALASPPPGGMAAGAAGTARLSELISAQDFSVAAVMVLDVVGQQYRSFVAGAPSFVNTLGEDSLTPDSIVWMRRDRLDGSASGAAGTRVAAVTSEGATTPGGSTSGGGSPRPTSGAAPAPADLLRHMTYEAGSATIHGLHAASSGLGTTTEASRRGTHAGYALLTPRDPRWAGGGFRAEWHGDDHIAGPGTERWHGISFYFPKDYDQGKNSTWDDRIIFQFADEGSPMFSLHLDAARQELWLRRKLPTRGADGQPRFETLGRWAFETERWYDIAFHAIWTTDRTGVFEMYIDGERRASYSGRTLAERRVTYSKWGIYGQPTRLLFDEVRIADGPDRLADISP